MRANDWDVMEKELPPEIGPHEGREIALMQAGKKHVAMFIGYIPEELPALLVGGEFSTLEIEQFHKETPYTTTIAYRCTHRADAEELLSILETYGKFSPEKERCIGRILSYTEHEISVFIEHFMHESKRVQ